MPRVHALTLVELAWPWLRTDLRVVRERMPTLDEQIDAVITGRTRLERVARRVRR
jgi:hypothetical protein